MIGCEDASWQTTEKKKLIRGWMCTGLFIICFFCVFRVNTRVHMLINCSWTG